MTKNQFINRLKQRLANNTDTDLDFIIEQEMDHVQENILEGADFWPWFLLSETVDANTTALERRVAVPSDFLTEWEDGTLWRYDESSSDDKWVELKKDDYDANLARYPGDGAPVKYSQDSNYLYLFPRPAIVYPLKMKYYKRQILPSNLQNSETNPWLTYAADWFMGEVGVIIAGFHLDMPQYEQRFAGHANRARERLYNLNVAKEEQNNQRSMGD